MAQLVLVEILENICAPDSIKPAGLIGKLRELAYGGGNGAFKQRTSESTPYTGDVSTIWVEHFDRSSWAQYVGNFRKEAPGSASSVQDIPARLQPDPAKHADVLFTAGLKMGIQPF